MKKNIFFLFLVLTASCNNLFHDEADDYIVINNRKEAVDLLNGMYSNLVKVYDNNYFQALVRGDDINIYERQNFTGTGFDDRPYKCQSSSIWDLIPPYENIYLRFYKIIISANSLLLQLSEENEPDLLGEAYFLRAYAYFTLARFFGNPVLVTDIDVNFSMDRPNYIEVYRFIESDMLKALQLLPEAYLNARIPGETPHKGTAKALLAEIYLNWAGYPINDKSKYLKASQLAGDVIQHEDYYGFRLLDDFADLWNIKNKHNKEYVFGLFYDIKNTETQNLINKVFISKYYTNEAQFKVQSNYQPEFKFFIKMPMNYRKRISYNTGQTVMIVPLDNSQPYYKYFDLNPIINPCGYLKFVASMKWVDTINIHLTATGGVASEMTLYLLRYTQTLLTFAEARAHSGILDDSTYEAVNMIRRRANKLDPHSPSAFDIQKGLTSEQLCDSIVWERAWELCAEPNGRWFDIVRLDLKDNLPGYRYDFDFPYEVPQEFLQDNWYFYQLPE